MESDKLKPRIGLHLKALILFTSFFVLNKPTQVQSQATTSDSIPEVSEVSSDIHTNNFSGGIQAGLLSLEGFARVETGMYFKIGAAFEYGFNITPLVLAAGEHFAKKNSINFSDEGGESDYLLTLRGFSLFINFDAGKKADITMGYKSLRVYTDAADSSFRDGDGINGKFKGFFVQPAFGKGWFQYSCSLLVGRFSTDALIFNDPVAPEFGIMFQPLIIRLVSR